MIGWFFLGVLFLLSGITYLFIEFKYISRIRKLKIISITRLIYSLTYGIFAALLCFLYAIGNIELALSNLVIMEYDANALSNLYLFWFFSVIGYLSLNVAYKIFAEKKVRISKRISSSDRYDLTEQQVILIGLAALFIGAFSLYMWTKDLGGVLEFIPLASGIRGDYLNSYGNTHTAWRQPAKITIPAAFIFYFLALRKDTKRKLLTRILFVISMVIAVLYLLCNDGRLTTALFLALLIIAFFTHGSVKIKNPKKLIIRLAVVAVLAGILLANLDNITYMIRHQTFVVPSDDSESNIITTLMEEFLFVYKSGITAIQTTLWEGGPLQFINDFVLGITAYLPSRFTPDGFIRVFRYNTALCTGSTSTTTATIPTDIISYSIYVFGWLGPVIVTFVIGMIISLLEGHFRGKKRDAYHMTIYYGLIMAFFRVVNYCEFQDLALSLFPYIVIYIITHACLIILGKKRKDEEDLQRF